MTNDEIYEARRIIKNMPNAPSIEYNSDCASYNPHIDRVQMRPQNSYGSAEEYYNTLFHELAHSTGHTTRLARFGPEELAAHNSGDEFYNEEEYIAEMAAAILCSTIGSGERLVIQATGKAQKAADYILGKQCVN